MTAPEQPAAPAGQLYQLTVIATGEVRDADGNLLNTVPIEMTRTVTEEQARQIRNATEESL